MPALAQTFSTQARVIWAVLGRDILLRHKESPLGIMSALVEPLASLLVLSAVFAYIRMAHPQTGDYVLLFLMTGIFPISAFRNAVSGGERTAMRMRRTLTLPQVSTLDLIIAGGLSSVIVIGTLFMLITYFFVFVLHQDVPENMVMALVPFFCNMIMGLGFAGINMTIKSWFPFWGVIWGTLTAPLPLLSGMFYTAQHLPPGIREYAYYNPLFHATELCREWYFPEYESPIFDWRYYGGWVFGCFFVGLLCERVFRYRFTLEKR